MPLRPCYRHFAGLSNMLRLLDADPRSRMPGGASRRWVVVVSAVVMAGTALPMVMSSDTADPVDSPPPSPRPPQAPLPPPFPPPPLDQVIMTTGTASSELIDYTETKRYNISALIASDVAVDASLVTTEVEQGSVMDSWAKNHRMIKFLEEVTTQCEHEGEAHFAAALPAYEAELATYLTQLAEYRAGTRTFVPTFPTYPTYKLEDCSLIEVVILTSTIIVPQEIEATTVKSALETKWGTSALASDKLSLATGDTISVVAAPMLTINEVGGDSDDMSVAIIAGASVGGVIAVIIIYLVIWHFTCASGK